MPTLNLFYGRRNQNRFVAEKRQSDPSGRIKQPLIRRATRTCEGQMTRARRASAAMMLDR